MPITPSMSRRAAAERTRRFYPRRSMLLPNGPLASKPPAPLEPDDRQHRAEHDHGKPERIAPGPVQLRHELEVHAVDAGDHSRRNANHRNHGENPEQIVLRDVDEAEHGIEQELYLVGQMLLERIQRSHIARHTFEA